MTNKLGELVCLTDKIGQNVDVGDILVEECGWGPYTMYNVWEMPPCFDGHGIKYNIEGKKYMFAWASAKSATKLDVALLPEEFVFSFHHGMGDINAPNIYQKEDIYTIIKFSNWKEKMITQDDVDKYIAASKIKLNSFMDIYDNWDILFAGKYLPADAGVELLQLFKITSAPIINGELGLAIFQDHLRLYGIYHTLADYKEQGVLREKCLEWDEKYKRS